MTASYIRILYKNQPRNLRIPFIGSEALVKLLLTLGIITPETTDSP